MRRMGLRQPYSGPVTGRGVLGRKTSRGCALAGCHARRCSCGRASSQPAMAMGSCACTKPALELCVPRSVHMLALYALWTWLQRQARSVPLPVPWPLPLHRAGLSPALLSLTTSFQLLSAAEDTFVHLWQLSRSPEDGAIEVSVGKGGVARARASSRP